MKNLNELIGTPVYYSAKFFDRGDIRIWKDVIGVVKSIEIGDGYFRHHDGNIDICVNLEPPRIIPKEFTLKDYNDIPLEKIRYDSIEV